MPEGHDAVRQPYALARGYTSTVVRPGERFRQLAVGVPPEILDPGAKTARARGAKRAEILSGWVLADALDATA